MRSFATAITAVFILLFSAPAEARDARFATPEQVMQWIHDYRKKPEPSQLPQAVRAMRHHGLLKNQDKAGLFIGFIAGVLGANQAKASKLIAALFPMPAKEQGVIVKAIAYSGLPEWPMLLSKFEKRMPLRKPLIDDFITGREATLDEMRLDEGPFVMDALWGYYAATGYHQPVVRIIAALPWVNDIRGTDGFSWAKVRAAFDDEEGKEVVRKVTAGHMAKWTLTANAERDRSLIELYKLELKYQPEVVAEPLREVIAAAESFEADKVREEAKVAIDKVKAKNPGDAGWTRGTYAGSVAIATGCVVASVAMPVAAAPCVIGGALYSGAVKIWNTAR